MKVYSLLILAVIITGCKKDKAVLPGDILGFTILSVNNPSLSGDVTGIIKNDTITFTLANDTVTKTLIPDIQVSQGAVVSPASNQKENFSQPVTYMVKAAGGAVKSYEAICKTAIIVPSSAQLAGLKINGADCGYSVSSNTYYYPVLLNTSLNNYTINFDTTKAKAIMLGNIKVANGGIVNSALSTNQQVTVQALDKFNKPVNYSLIISGLPIVKLTASQEIADADVSGVFSLVNPDYKAESSQLEISSNMMISIRGNTARTYPKKAYSMHLVDAQGNDADVSLLGLRTDNGWILDAMYIDQARMRNRVCTDLWNSFNNVPYIASEPTALNGTRGYMTELFLNNEYWGIYCLTEKIDRKQLQVKKSYGDIYKADDWSPEVEFNGVSAYNNNSETWSTWGLEYPDIGDTPAPNWGYLYNVVNFVSSSTNADFMSQIANKVDLNNMADYFIFTNATGGFDNQSKNTYFSFYDYRNAPQFFYTMWDMDATLGRYWDGSLEQPNALIAGGDNNNLINRLIALNPGNFRQIIKARWQALKTNQLSQAALKARIELYRQQLVNTNAFGREMAKWGNITRDLNAETTYMENWYVTQYALLDEYINNL
jgi:hypothetical protein